MKSILLMDRLGRTRPLALATAVAAMLAACGGTPAPASSPGNEANAGTVAFLSSQAQPVNEAEGMRRDVLAAFNGTANFDSSRSDAQIVQQVQAEERAGKVTVDLIGGLHGDFPQLGQAGQLEDLTPLLQKLERDRHFNADLLKYGKLGTGKQYYIPWMQATYMMVANKKALPYLPKGADINNLSYDQLIQWGQNLKQTTGENKVGLPASSKGLIHRGVQGYWYPSFTGAEVTGFKSPEAVNLWQTYRRLWAVSSAQSTNYAFMQEPLQSGEVWVAWDHQARLIDALNNSPDQFVVFPAPSGPKGLGYMAVVVGLAIPKGAPNAKGAEALIDYLTQPKNQVKAVNVIGFFSVLSDASARSTAGLKPGVALEAAAAARQSGSKNAIPALLPVGLGAKDAEFNKAYVDTFTRIILRNEDIQTVLNSEAQVINDLLNTANAPCWPPDSTSSGACQVK
ncbi:MAG TPA: ABC transporter substrate-binding protein [Candidatus Dormibacteraeota bacterium]|nr:ABC transporter substrate-binding protein [Candidatus Dormibacteraeota bacterium]